MILARPCVMFPGCAMHTCLCIFISGLQDTKRCDKDEAGCGNPEAPIKHLQDMPLGVFPFTLALLVSCALSCRASLCIRTCALSATCLGL